MDFSEAHHPAWKKCSPSAKLLHQRNLRIITGIEALHGEIVQEVKFVVCWTKGGKPIGGTSQALRIADSANIPIFNFGLCMEAEEVENMIQTMDDFQKSIE